jgi:hypothetical protein
MNDREANFRYQIKKNAFKNDDNMEHGLACSTAAQAGGRMQL